MKFISRDDLIAFAGFCFISAGIYLWLGLAAVLIFTGIVLVYIGVRYEPHQNPNA